LARPGAHQPFKSWTAGDRLDYTAWAPGVPNDWAGNEPCAHFFAWVGKWNDIACHHRFYGIIESPIMSACGAGPAVSSSQPAPVVANPAVPSLHWRMNGQINDLSGNGANAYLAGSVSWTQTAPAGPRSFLATTASIKFDSGAFPQVYNPKSIIPYLIGDASFTFMVWAYYDLPNWPSDWVGVFGTSAPLTQGAFNNGVGLAIYQGNPAVQIYGSEVRSRTAINTKTWYHVAGTKASGTLDANTRIYVNGIEQEHFLLGSDATPNIIPGVPMLGRAGDVGTKTLPERYFHGYLKDARVYPSALPAASIKTIYASEW